MSPREQGQASATAATPLTPPSFLFSLSTPPILCFPVTRRISPRECKQAPGGHRTCSASVPPSAVRPALTTNDEFYFNEDKEGAWVAQTVNFGLGRDLRVMGLSPALGSMLSVESARGSLSLSSSPPALSLSLNK